MEGIIDTDDKNKTFDDDGVGEIDNPVKDDIEQDVDVDPDLDTDPDIDVDPDDIVDEDDIVEENDDVVSVSEVGEESKGFANSSIGNLIQENSDDNINYDSEESDDEPIDSKIKFNEKMDYIKKYHTQEITEDYEEISILATVKRNEDGVIIDSKHITTPIMTKYEKTRILGLRISQLNNGAPSLYVPENMIIDNNIIAEIELRDKLLPFIISRPLPNGSKEHWRIQDLEIL